MKHGWLLMCCALLSGGSLSADWQTRPGLSADLRAFYFSGDRSHRQDREALAIGGIIRYETSLMHDLDAAAAFYSSHDLLHRGSGAVERITNASVVTDSSDIGGNSELVRSDGSAIDTLGEAYVQYRHAKSLLRIGRQRLHSPMLNDFYNRFLPNTFEALLIENRDLPDTTVSIARIERWKYKAEEAFKGIGEGMGWDTDLYMASMINRSRESLTAELHYYRLVDVMDALYVKLASEEIATFADDSRLYGALHYLRERDSGDNLAATLPGNSDSRLDTYLSGMMAGYKTAAWDFRVMADKVGADTILGSGADYAALGWSSFLNFTDIQIDGEALNAGALSYGGSVTRHIAKSLSAAVKYVHIHQDDAKQLASYTPNRRPSSDEWNLDLRYHPSHNSGLRLRLARIDYASNHLITNEYDETNLRLIYDYRFTVAK